MNIQETAAVLARVQAYHQGFKVNDAKILAWYELLEPYMLRDCIEAVKDYFKDPGDWIMPADVIQRVKGYRAKRLQAIGGTAYLSPADERAAIESGSYSEAMADLNRLAADGHLPPARYAAYHEGRVALTDLSRKEIAP